MEAGGRSVSTPSHINSFRSTMDSRGGRLLCCVVVGLVLFLAAMESISVGMGTVAGSSKPILNPHGGHTHVLITPTGRNNENRFEKEEEEDASPPAREDEVEPPADYENNNE